MKELGALALWVLVTVELWIVDRSYRNHCTCDVFRSPGLFTQRRQMFLGINTELFLLHKEHFGITLPFRIVWIWLSALR